jgi:hypothetical protein
MRGARKMHLVARGQPMNSLICYDAACRAIAEAKTVDEVRHS